MNLMGLKYNSGYMVYGQSGLGINFKDVRNKMAETARGGGDNGSLDDVSSLGNKLFASSIDIFPYM